MMHQRNRDFIERVVTALRGTNRPSLRFETAEVFEAEPMVGLVGALPGVFGSAATAIDVESAFIGFDGSPEAAAAAFFDELHEPVLTPCKEPSDELRRLVQEHHPEVVWLRLDFGYYHEAGA